MIERRKLLKLGAAAAAGLVTSTGRATPSRKIWIVVDPDDRIATAEPVVRAVGQLRAALTARGVGSVIVPVAPASTGDLVLTLAGTSGGHPEGFTLAPGLRASSAGPLGLAYAILELADRVHLSDGADLDLDLPRRIEEEPHNDVRSVARSFCSVIEDSAWYYDKAFWRDYLDMLVASRFNRFALFFGFGYDFPRNISDDYFQLPYVFLFDVPGYDVRLQPPLPPGERERNFDMLRFIATETAARGLHFQLGIWTHAYEWVDSPNAAHRIEGLTPATHAAYCRDALRKLLIDCPQINGLTFRVHVESGIADGAFAFWRTLFAAFEGIDRPVEIDMHAKGITDEMVAIADATGMPMTISPKFSGEHMGLGYHQADIREYEIPTPERIKAAGQNSSSGARRFTRYGYADLFVEGRKYGILHRLWPGSQRFLLWGDPATAAAYSRAASFCGSAGLEICEALTFKGREASGTPGGSRNAYRDRALDPKPGDWSKFAYSYRLWGRLLYDPAADRRGWGRWLNRTFGAGATAAETALAQASRTLPLFTTAHIPSTSNRYYWPEIYDNMPIMPIDGYRPIADLPKPYSMADISPLDPQLFSSIAEQVASIVAGRADARYSPAEVGQALAGFAGMATTALDRMPKSNAPERRRWVGDIRIQIGLARFFAAKLQSGLLYELYRGTGRLEYGRRALAIYARGRADWVAMAEPARQVYVPDISFGTEKIIQRGHWSDRVHDIDRDIAAMRAALAGAAQAPADAPVDIAAILDPKRPDYAIRHDPADSFAPASPLNIDLVAEGRVRSATLLYRHVNHAERWRSTAMTPSGRRFEASIPGSYTASPYPLQYYFELDGDAGATLAPALGPQWTGQPYHAVWRRA